MGRPHLNISVTAATGPHKYAPASTDLQLSTFFCINHNSKSAKYLNELVDQRSHGQQVRVTVHFNDTQGNCC